MSRNHRDTVPNVHKSVGDVGGVGDLVEIAADGTMHLHLHEGQQRAWESERRFVLMLAGTQSGKTSFGPHWLLREIRHCGQGDYLVVTPTYPLLDLKALPAFLRLFNTHLHLGRFTASPARKFIFSPEGERRTFGSRYDPSKSTRVLFGYATEPESLESATANAAWLDEAGQKRFKPGSWEAVRRRLSLKQGRVLVTTSLYTQNWVKTLYDHACAGDPNIEIVQFDSTENPQFSREEFEDARGTLPRWRFNMQYRGQFERPPGLIFDCLDPAMHFISRFAIPQDWPRHLGLDFGTQNMAAVFAAQEPETRRLYVYRIYHRGGLSTWGHVRNLLHGELGIPHAVGGAPSEHDWRGEFRLAGLPVRRPHDSDLELGINRVYGAIQSSKLFFCGDLTELKEELLTYSRRLNEREEPTEEIEDKAEYHLLDALRYLVSDVAGPRRIATSGRVDLYAPRLRTLKTVPRPPGRTPEEVERMLASAAVGQ